MGMMSGSYLMVIKYILLNLFYKSLQKIVRKMH